MITFNMTVIIIGICVSFLLGYLISDAKKAGEENRMFGAKGLFIDHETLGKMRENWINYGIALGKKEIREELNKSAEEKK